MRSLKPSYNKFICTLALGVLVSGTVSCKNPSLDDERKKTIYALGLSIGERLESFDIKKEEMDVLRLGVEDGMLKNKPQVELQAYFPKIQEMSMAKMKTQAEEEKKAAVDFLAKAAAEEGATKTDSGLIFKSMTEGTGATPKSTDVVKVHYHGTLRDGKVFDSSVQRGEPATFPLDRVIPCWTEGVQKIKKGGKAKLVCPADIAYGDRGAPPDIKPGAALTFEVELLDIVDAAKAAKGAEAKAKPAKPAKKK